MPPPAIVRALSEARDDVSNLALLDNADGSQAVGTIEVTVVVHLVLVMPYLFHS